MEGTRIREREEARLGRVDGDLRAEDHALIRAADGRSVSVSGRAEFEGSVEIDCDFECGSMESRDGLVRVNGNLTVRGRIDVDEALYTHGTVKADDVDVGGKFESARALRFDSIDTGGIVALGGGEGRIVEVGGKLRSDGDLRCEEVRVGGVADVIGGLWVKTAEVGGKIRVSGDLHMEERLQVGGMAEIGGVLSGRDVEVGGILKASRGVLTGSAEVGGRVETSEGFRAQSVELGRGARCVGALVGGRVRIGRTAQVEDVYCTDLEVEGGTRMGRVYAENADIGDNCVIERLIYTKELREGHRVIHRNPPEKAEKLPSFPL